MLEVLRRRLALAICPELACLPHGPGFDAPRRRARSTEGMRWGEELRRLDRLYAAQTGVVLTLRTAPAYDGPLYAWGIRPVLVRARAIGALVRLRANPGQGILSPTHFLTLNYLAAIWPAGAPWPADILRPTTKEAA
jgi:hypothetical protein